MILELYQIRSLGTCQLNTNEIDVELFVWKESSVLILHSLFDSEVRDFSLIRAALSNVEVFGAIHRIAGRDVIIIKDTQEKMIEVLLSQNHDYVFEENANWSFCGNITVEALLPLAGLGADIIPLADINPLADLAIEQESKEEDELLEFED
uniref:Uncharacterized protein n=1 Tax=Panagrolaimus sp. ES5 TaxID=591445 RepID=A0AC34GY07_9BILA